MFAGSPVLLLLSGFHGNTDPLMIAFLLLAGRPPETGRPSWAAGLAYGMSLSIKLWPAILGRAVAVVQNNEAPRPVRRGGRRHVPPHRHAVSRAGPVAVLRQVLSYRSLYGQWGLSQILVSIPLPALSQPFEAYGTFVVLLLCFAATLWMHLRTTAPLLLRIGFLTALFLALTPGFGIQYLAWLLPWLAALSGEHLLLYSIGAGWFQFLVYNFWARGLPWSFADSTMVGPWRDSLILPEILCWLLVLYLLWQFAHSMELLPQSAQPIPVEAAPARRGNRR